MPADYTSTGLIAAVRRNAVLGTPSTPNAFPTNTDILAWLNEELGNRIVTVLMRPREERFVEYLDFSTVAGQDEYDVPRRSLYENTRDIQTLVNNNWISLPRIQPELGNSYLTTQAQPSAYFIRNNKVVLFPVPAGSVSMRLKYFLRPGYIVSSGYAIPNSFSAGVTPGTYSVGVASTSGMSNGYFDFVDKNTPFNPLLVDIAGTVLDATTLILTMTAAQATVATNAVYNASAYVIGAGDAPGPQIPEDLISLLEQWTTYRALVAKKDIPGAEAQKRACDETQRAIVQAMNVRTDGFGQKVVSRAFGFGRRGGFWGGFGGPSP